jgi:hypothetical protein
MYESTPEDDGESLFHDTVSTAEIRAVFDPEEPDL